MVYQSARFNAMRTGRYNPANTRFPTTVYPQIVGLPVQFLLPRGEDFGTLLSAQGNVANVSYINDALTQVAQGIIDEDQAPHFEEVDWKSGVVIEGILTATSEDTIDEVKADLVGDFGDVAGVHFVGVVAIPYKFWQVSRDRYDLGMRRATLMRSMARLGMLACGNKTCCWLLPRYKAESEYQAMLVCDKLVSGNHKLESELSFKQFPDFPLKNGMVYDFTLPWAGHADLLRVPSLDQIEDALL